MTIATLALRLNDFPCVVTSTSEIRSTYATDFMGDNPASASLEDIVSERLDKFILAAERSIGSRSNPGNIGGEMMPAPYTLPLRIRKSGESFPVEEANGVALANVYFEEDPSRRGLVNRLSGADAKAVGQMIARALMEAAKRT
jgi:hypothetical protein